MTPELASPCVQICQVEAGICQGCGRTLDEITRWPSATPLVKRSILAAAKARRSAARSASPPRNA